MTKAKEQTIYMSDDELQDRFRRAGGICKDTIVIMAELNGCSRLKMCQHLGYASMSDAPDFTQDEIQIRKLYDMGMSDRKIATLTKNSKGTIRHWRKRNQLPCHYTMKKEVANV